MLQVNILKQKLERGDFVLGTWAVIPSPVTVDIIASTGVDFIIIDSEHGPISFETAQLMVMACESRNVSPVMRVGTISEDIILKALDIGVHAIQVPNICTANDVREVIRLSKYPPVGSRGFSPFTRAGNYSISSGTILTQEANRNTLVAINIEGEEAIAEIDTVLKIAELDIVFVGLFDLSKALNVPGETEHPAVLAHLESLVKKISASGKYAGTISTSVDKIERYIAMGVQYIVHLVDCDMLRSTYHSVVESFSAAKHKVKS